MKKYLRDFLIILITTLLLLEVALRLLGYQAFHFPPFTITSEPAGALIPHSEFGLALQPGTFKITMNDSLEYSSERQADSTRFTGNRHSQNHIDFHGCSFTYGMAVNTEDAFAYLLQEKVDSQFSIRNKAVPGYGNIQGLLSLKQSITQKATLPQTIIMFYASFHDDRNALNPQYREHLYYGFLNMDQEIKEKFNNASHARFPYAQMNDQKLQIQHSSTKQLFKPLPLREHSALVNLIQKTTNNQTNSQINSNQISQEILLEMNRLCKENEIEFIVASIVKDTLTSQTLAELRKSGVSTLDMGLDILNDNQYNNLPYDSHPNALAHRIYAEKLYQFLNEETFD